MLRERSICASTINLKSMQRWIAVLSKNISIYVQLIPLFQIPVFSLMINLTVISTSASSFQITTNAVLYQSPLVSFLVSN